MNHAELSELARQASERIVAAAEVVRLRVAEGNLKWETKDNFGDLVADLDREIEESLARELTRLLPGSSHIGEESPAEEGVPEFVWVIDPIDGSTNAIHGLQHAAVSVALCRNLMPVLGVIANPFTRDTFWAIRDHGAWRSTADGPAVSLAVSRTGTLQTSLISFGLPYDKTAAADIFRTAMNVFRRCQDMRRRGSAALDLASVAAGEMDGHFEYNLRLWDIAAAGLIVEEAGGRLTNWQGETIQWEGPSDQQHVLVSNERIHDELIEAVALGAVTRQD